MSNKVKLETSKGVIELELFEKECPISTENFKKYVGAGFYDGTIFHRIIPGFMVQGGGMEPGLVQKKTEAAIKNEAKDAPSNQRGTVAMARTMNPDSATCQFFINLVDNKRLDYVNASNQGYCVFAKVTQGMDVVDAMATVVTGQRGPHGDVPKEDILIIRATLEN